MKTVQIDETLFLELVKYHLLDYYDHENTIRQGLQTKFDSMVRRDLYTKMKTATTDEEREQARREYLDKIGIPADFRW